MREYNCNTTMDPVSNGSVVDKVIQQIKNAIIHGRFKPGEKLPSEFALMDELQVSRNSLREAMKILSAMGVLVIRRGDGTYINTEYKASIIDHLQYSLLFESGSVDDIAELRQLIEEDVLILAVRKCTSEDISKLETLIESMEVAFSNKNLVKAAKADYAFHLFLIECCRNSFLKRVVDGLYPIYEESIENTITKNELNANSVLYHRAILECIKQRNEAMVPQAIADSLSIWKGSIKNDGE